MKPDYSRETLTIKLNVVSVEYDFERQQSGKAYLSLDKESGLQKVSF